MEPRAQRPGGGRRARTCRRSPPRSARSMRRLEPRSASSAGAAAASSRAKRRGWRPTRSAWSSRWAAPSPRRPPRTSAPSGAARGGRGGGGPGQARDRQPRSRHANGGKGCVPSLPGGWARRNGCPLAIPSTRLELGAVRKRKLYRAGNKDFAGPRQVGQSRGEVHGFADGGVASPRSADDDFPDCEAGMHHEVAVKSARQNRHALAQLHRSPWPVYDCWV